ncbi:MAG TPA: hypothetical protein VLH75_14840 [Longimicrobiales bacterium]|nr:hypothetical protein [Longimicrobiales bacterium]
MAGIALQISSGHFDIWALVGILLALALGVAGCAGLAIRDEGGRWTRRVLSGGILLCLALMALQSPGKYLETPSPWANPPLLAGLVVAAVALAVSTRADPWARRAWFPVALAAYAGLGIWLIHASPDPHIDVITVHREAIEALQEGRSPYGITFPNIYPDGRFYPEGMTAGGRVLFGLPYPPVSLLLAAPGHILGGDIRYAELAAFLATAVLLAVAGGGEVAKLAAMAFLFTPRSLFVLEQGWTEPFAVLCLALVVASARRFPRVLPVALGLLLGVKQYLVIAALLVPWLVPGGDRRRGSLGLLARAGATAAVVTLPFVLWDPGGFWRSVVALQFREQVRVDSLSVLTGLSPAYIDLAPGAIAGVAVAALAAGYTMALARIPRTPAGFAAALGLMCLLLFVFGKKAFCNYYYFVIGAWCCAIAASPDEHERPSPDVAAPPRGPGGLRFGRRH